MTYPDEQPSRKAFSERMVPLGRTGTPPLEADRRTLSVQLWFEQLGQDLRFSFRQLRKSAGFAATVIVTVGLGIGACTVVFSAVHAILLEMTDTPEAARTVVIHESEPPRRPQMGVSPPAFLDLRAHAKSFELLTAWVGGSVTLTDGTEPLQLDPIVALRVD